MRGISATDGAARPRVLFRPADCDRGHGGREEECPFGHATPAVGACTAFLREAGDDPPVLSDGLGRQDGRKWPCLRLRPAGIAEIPADVLDQGAGFELCADVEQDLVDQPWDRNPNLVAKRHAVAQELPPFDARNENPAWAPIASEVAHKIED
jgi:hypothetical protein